MRKTKIVCTLGPATAGVAKLEELIRAGLDAARLNFSHGSHEDHRQMVLDLREAAKRVGRPVALLGDLCGPKIRIGKMPDGGMPIEPGETLRLRESGEASQGIITHSYPSLARDVRKGEPILIDDGLIRLQVEATEGEDVLCSVKIGGVLKDHKGMNLPKSRLSVPALTEKDKQDVLFAREIEVDYLALSFVRQAEDIQELNELAPGIPVIAKIEKPEAVENLESILDAADGLMVARGDLGVELGHEKVPLVQKRIISAIRSTAKPVITATQMLESMIQNATPTRAEVSDVANAVLDGTDAVMLSGETSIGRYPVQTVQIMASIIDEIESSARYFRPNNGNDLVLQDRSFSSMIAKAATSAVNEFKLAAMAVYTQSGRTAALVSAARPQANLIAFSPDPVALNRLSLFWGVCPLYGKWANDTQSVVEQAEKGLLQQGLVSSGQNIAITFGLVLDEEPFQTNVLKLWKVR